MNTTFFVSSFSDETGLTFEADSWKYKLLTHTESVLLCVTSFINGPQIFRSNKPHLLCQKVLVANSAFGQSAKKAKKESN